MKPLFLTIGLFTTYHQDVTMWWQTFAGMLAMIKHMDTWTGKSLGAFTDKFSVNINNHGAGFYRLSAGKK
ncbi:hypothetical protein FAM09_15185 [Niastella caeni]|uniref:Uncharacterized protein n=1 Tax=Niastella caeni TaxID=2569763 RepID=A0A4S8HRA4_9BACT|nr:hypothetical protein [Niastella caeni]THU38027.1 hypothetical protein FAM09_15185 [Niastella caeni]